MNPRVIFICGVAIGFLALLAFSAWLVRNGVLNVKAFEHYGRIDREAERWTAARIDADEVAYLCREAGRYFRKALAPTDVVWTYSGVRPLFDDGASKAQEATRDYVLKVEQAEGEAPLATVYKRQKAKAAAAKRSSGTKLLDRTSSREFIRRRQGKGAKGFLGRHSHRRAASICGFCTR